MIMGVRRALAGAVVAMVLAGGGVLISSGAAEAAPTGCYTVVEYVPVVVYVSQQVYENGQWVTKLVPVTVFKPVTRVVCD
jgi:hypothetical protein